MNDLRRMPRYRSHKEVSAFKIESLEVETAPPLFTGLVCRGSAALGTACGVCERCDWEKSRRVIIRPEDKTLAPEFMPLAWAWERRAQPGGYFVRYDDGYTSYSPAKAFEEGYQAIPPSIPAGKKVRLFAIVEDMQKEVATTILGDTHVAMIFPRVGLAGGGLDCFESWVPIEEKRLQSAMRPSEFVSSCLKPGMIALEDAIKKSIGVPIIDRPASRVVDPLREARGEK